MTAPGYCVVLVPESMKSLAPADVAFCGISDYDEEAELALAYRTRESAPCVRRFVKSAIATFAEMKNSVNDGHRSGGHIG